MITRVHERGTDLIGLFEYLWGPGRAEEHDDPRVIASWWGSGDVSSATSPPDGGPRPFDVLATLLMDPVLFCADPPEAPVWHCSVRLAPDDRSLPDVDWKLIAADIVAGAGLAPRADPDAVRWVAVRHGTDHIHIAATLVRQDGRPEPAWRDYDGCRGAARDVEARYGLAPTPPADRTAPSRPGPRELNKARRLGRAGSSRERLRRQVRHAAAASQDLDEFVARLRDDGVLVRFRRDPHGDGGVVGYAVASPDDLAGDGHPVYYGGGRLAPDLSLPQLRLRWAGAAAAGEELGREEMPRAAAASALCGTLAALVDDARTRIGSAGAQERAEGLAGAHAAADTLIVLGRLVGEAREEPVRGAGEALDRAVARRWDTGEVRWASAERIRVLSRLMAVIGALSNDREWVAALRLLLAISRLADTLAELRCVQRRLDQTRSARRAAELLRGFVGDSGGVPGAVGWPATGPPGASPTRSATSLRDRRRERPAAVAERRR